MLASKNVVDHRALREGRTVEVEGLNALISRKVQKSASWTENYSRMTIVALAMWNQRWGIWTLLREWGQTRGEDVKFLEANAQDEQVGKQRPPRRRLKKRVHPSRPEDDSDSEWSGGEHTDDE